MHATISARPRKVSCLWMVVVAYAGCLGTLQATQPAESQRPNVLLVLTDDQGYGDIGSHGNPVLKTPVMDRLAASGARFERFFVSPVCAPTRASLLTGRYHVRTGVSGVTRGYETLRSDEWTLAEMFRESGYATGAFGKWHNGRHMPNHPNGQGFQQFVGFCGGHWNTYFNPPLERNGEPFRAEGYINDVITDEANEFIRSNKQRPFFCYVPYNTPHSPWRAPESSWRKYGAQQLDTKAQAAYAMIDNLDANLGRLLKTLDQNGLRQNTIVLFLTDNGANSDRFNAGMRGRKGSIDEGGTRVPLFVRFPGVIRPGRRIQPISFHLDILPTLAELCRVSIPAERQTRLDGRSLAPLLRGETAGRRWPERRLFTVRYRTDVDPDKIRGAVRTSRWRATRSGNRWRLYDMHADPGQQHDVASKNAETVDELAASFQRWLAEVTDPLPTLPPIPLGHATRNVFSLPANEATLHPGFGEGIEWTGDTENGFANCWIHHWTSDDAHLAWRIEVLKPGRYAFELQYACAREDVGCQMRLSVGDQLLIKNVGLAHDPPLASKPDRIYSNNYQDKTSWATLRMGGVTLKAGLIDVRLHTKIIRDQSIQLRRIVVRRE